MEIKLYYNKNMKIDSNIKYNNFEFYIKNKNRVIFNKLSDKNNIKID